MKRRLIAVHLFGAMVVVGGVLGCGPREVPEAGPRPIAGAEVLFGLGLSSAADPFRAGALAARQALAPIGGRRLRAALVLDSFPADERTLLLEGITSQIEAYTVFGGSVDGVLTSLGAPAGRGVAVLALGGEDLLTAEGTAAPEDEKEGARAVAARLATAVPKTRRDGLLFLLGHGKSVAGADLLAGLTGRLGTNEMVLGAPVASEGGTVYFRARPAADAVVAVRLKGAIAVACASRSAGAPRAQNPQTVLASAQEAARTLMAGREEEPPPLLALVVSDTTRRDALAEPDDEVKALQEVLGPAVPIFGCYAPTQIGPPGTGMPALAVEGHVVICLVRARPLR